MNQFVHDKLPSGWAELPMLELATTITKGSTPTTYGHDYKSAGISFVRVENLVDGRINREALTTFIDEQANQALRRSQLQIGDVLYSIAGTIGRTAIVRERDLPANTNQALAIIRGTDTVLMPSYLIHFLSTSFSQQETFLKARGGAMNNISLSDIEKIVVPVAPRSEQKRIVEEIEKQFTRLDAAVAALKRIRANLKRYRAAVLKAACEGRLVLTEAELAQREGRSYEPASVLLERILAERRSHWEATQLAKLLEQPRDQKWKRRYKEPCIANAGDLPSLPDGWMWVSVEALSKKVVDGVHKKPNYVAKGIPFVTVKNLTAGPGISFDDLHYVTEPDHREFVRRADPAENDLLISKDGTLGVIRKIRTRREFSIFVSVAMIKPVLGEMSDYLELALSAPQVQIQMVPKGSGLQHIHLEDLRQDCIPVPPLIEQGRIALEVARRMSVIEEVDQELDAGLKRAARLRQSILKRAFEGKLVAQDFNDEPASVLLERARFQREFPEDHAQDTFPINRDKKSPGTRPRFVPSRRSL